MKSAGWAQGGIVMSLQESKTSMRCFTPHFQTTLLFVVLQAARFQTDRLLASAGLSCENALWSARALLL